MTPKGTLRMTNQTYRDRNTKIMDGMAGGIRSGRPGEIEDIVICSLYTLLRTPDEDQL